MQASVYCTVRQRGHEMYAAKALCFGLKVHGPFLVLTLRNSLGVPPKSARSYLTCLPKYAWPLGQHLRCQWGEEWMEGECTCTLGLLPREAGLDFVVVEKGERRERQTHDSGLFSGCIELAACGAVLTW